MARGSLAEGCHHWLGLLVERGQITILQAEPLMTLEKEISIKLANLIKATQKTRLN